MSVDKSAKALDAFRTFTGLPVESVKRTGHERVTMRYTFTLDDGRELRVDDRTLWSRTEFAREAVSKLKTPVETCEAAKWQAAVEALIIHTVEVSATPGERWEDVVSDWVGSYATGATSDRDGAAAAGAPFIADGMLHIKAEKLAVYIRREQVEQVKLHELYQALRDLGFERTHVNYVRGRDSLRTSTSYYRAPLEALEPRQAPDFVLSSTNG